jgi:phosphoribosylaminoimidazolecarboxamide formyltransferase/IMP cyclohydrolase
VIKHTNACGLASHPDLVKAFQYAWDADQKSAFGGIVTLNRPCPLAVAELLKGRFIEIIAAPAFEPDALEFLKKKSADLRIVTVDLNRLCDANLELHGFGGITLKTVSDIASEKDFTTGTTTPIPAAMQELLRFGVNSCANLKSNAVSLVCATPDGLGMMQLGMGCGQPNRIDALERLAIPKARENSKTIFGLDLLPKDTVLVSEAFFPFSDVIETSHQQGIRYIVQPGGSKRDGEVIAKCNEYGIAMAFTGVRHFRHF